MGVVEAVPGRAVEGGVVDGLLEREAHGVERLAAALVAGGAEIEAAHAAGIDVLAGPRTRAFAAERLDLDDIGAHVGK